MNAAIKEEICSIKDQIYHIAIELFAEFGYDSVSMEDIATAVGIETSAIYRCVVSKKKLRDTIYQYCAELYRNAEPDPDELLRIAETAPLQKLLEKMNYRMNPSDQALFQKILLIALHDFSFNPDSAKLIKDTILYPVENSLAPVLNKLVELKRIEPLDTSVMISIFKSLYLASTILHSSEFERDFEAEPDGDAILFSLVKPVSTCICGHSQ